MSKITRFDNRKSRNQKKESFQTARYVPKPLLPQSQAQAEYIHLLTTSIVTFGVGSAGTGKTYCATALAGHMLDCGKIKKIIITRPANQELGALPGTAEEKFAPHMIPVQQVLESIFGRNWYKNQIRLGNIVGVPLELIMGRTFDDSFIIADEMQNATPKQVYIMLSRVGEYSKVAVNGDFKMQQTIKGASGLADAVRRLDGVDGIGIYEFCAADIVRSGIAKEIIMRYEQDL
jgi:phosphate starvation-inducible protein PhoH and related proteins